MSIDELLDELLELKAFYGGDTRVMCENGPITNVNYVAEDNDYPAYVAIGWD